jgi:glycosyltransferase involved in cell wall biosynthesis
MICTYPIDVTNVAHSDRIHFMSKLKSWELNRITNYWLNPRRLPRNFDLYHISNQSLGRFARFAHPSVITVYDLIPLRIKTELPPRARFKGSFNRTIYRYFVRQSITSSERAEKIICPSKHTLQETAEMLHIDGDKLRLVEEGLDHDLFKPRDRAQARSLLGLDPDKKLVLHVGNERDPRKNLPVLVQALHQICRDLSDVVLVRVGDKTQGISNLIEANGIEAVYFGSGNQGYGKLTDRNLAYLYNAADLFVLPSYYEGTATTALEAMASGCPVICSNVTGNPDSVGDSAVLIDPWDVKSLAFWINEVLTREALSKDLSERGLKRSDLFSWERCAQQTLNVYEETLKIASHH